VASPCARARGGYANRELRGEFSFHWHVNVVTTKRKSPTNRRYNVIFLLVATFLPLSLLLCISHVLLPPLLLLLLLLLLFLFETVSNLAFPGLFAGR